jgi:hypothetical protein
MRGQYLLLGFVLCATNLVRADQVNCILHGNSPGRAGILDSTGAGCTDEDRAWLKANEVKINAIKEEMRALTPEQVKEEQAALLRQELADGEAQLRAEARQRAEDAERRQAKDLQEKHAAYQRGIDDEVSLIDRYETERAAQRGQQQAVEREPIAALRPRSVAPREPDPLTRAPAPAETPESRRAAGLPDDPKAAACIQDDDCARALLRGAK